MQTRLVAIQQLNELLESTRRIELFADMRWYLFGWIQARNRFQNIQREAEYMRSILEDIHEQQT